MQSVNYIDLFAGRKRFSQKQIELFEWYREQRQRKQAGEPFEHILAPVWGRRCGKSDGCSSLISEVIVDLLCDDADAIARGELEPWRGLGRPLMQQRKSKPHSLVFVVAPEVRDLTDISGHMLNVFSGDAEVFLHPNPRMQLIDGGTKMLFVHEQACLAVWFVPAKSAASMVGRGPSAVLITESGFIPSMHWDRLVPALWDKAAWVIAEGTPTQDPSHWFTQLAVSGLEPDHPEADRSIAKRDPRVHTSRANTIDHAYLPQARERAREELRYRGKRWGELWIFASWQQPADVVFDEYRPEMSVVEFDAWPVPIVKFTNGKSVVLPKPDRVEIDVDWHRGAAPGAAVCTYTWTRRNPLNPHDSRPLMLVVDEFQDDEVDGEIGKRLPYTPQGWWQVIKAMRDNWGAQRIYGDPTGIDLLKSARRNRLAIKPAENQDKDGRIQLINAQCCVPGDAHPALLIASTCKKTAHCLQTLQWRKDREGKSTNKPSGYNDHLADCLAYTAGRHARPKGLMPASMW